jgi:hypothetical protein
MPSQGLVSGEKQKFAPPTLNEGLDAKACLGSAARCAHTFMSAIAIAATVIFWL